MSWLQLHHQVVMALAPRPVQGELQGVRLTVAQPVPALAAEVYRGLAWAAVADDIGTVGRPG